MTDCISLEASLLMWHGPPGWSICTVLSAAACAVAVAIADVRMERLVAPADVENEEDDIPCSGPSAAAAVEVPAVLGLAAERRGGFFGMAGGGEIGPRC